MFAELRRGLDSIVSVFSSVSDSSKKKVLNFSTISNSLKIQEHSRELSLWNNVRLEIV